MKNTWIVWAGVITVIVVIVSVVNFQKKKDTVPLSEIFPEEEVVPMDIDYEFVDTPVEEQSQEPAVKEAVAKKEDRQLSSKEPVVSTRVSSTEKAVSVKAVSGKGPYSIQVASFRDKARAARVVQDLEAMGLSPVYVEARDLGAKGVWHRVYVGRFASKSEASPTVKKLKSKYKSCFVVKKKK